MDKSKYDKFKALDPFFNIVMKGLDRLVDGDHFWDAVADEAVFEFRYRFPGWPERLESRAAYMTAMEDYGMDLHSADGLVVHLTRDPRVVVLEYEVHGTAPSTGRPYDNRFCSIVTIRDRKIVRWRDYMDSLASRAGNVDFMTNRHRRLSLRLNHALQRVAASRCCCNRRASWPLSLSAGR